MYRVRGKTAGRKAPEIMEQFCCRTRHRLSLVFARCLADSTACMTLTSLGEAMIIEGTSGPRLSVRMSPA